MPLLTRYLRLVVNELLFIDNSCFNLLNLTGRLYNASIINALHFPTISFIKNQT